MIVNAYDPYISNALLAMTKQSPFSHEPKNLIKLISKSSDCGSKDFRCYPPPLSKV